MLNWIEEFLLINDKIIIFLLVLKLIYSQNYRYIFKKFTNPKPKYYKKINFNKK